MSMTWNQFKQHVDKLIAEKGISGDEEIWYIDISFPQATEIGIDDNGIDCPSVGIEDCGIIVS